MPATHANSTAGLEPAPTAGSAPEPDRAAGRLPVAIGGLAFVVALAVFCVHIGRPAYWQDEAFTVELTRRDWHQLARLIYHAEAPLGPYYTVMKPWLAISDAEWWARLPSAVAAALGVGLVARLVARTLGTTSAVATAAVLILLPTVSRYAQEARPYGIALFLGILASVAWWSLVTRSGVVRGLLYALTVVLVPLAHLLALSVVLAQILATPLAAAPGRRVRTTAVTIGWAALGAAVVSPFALLATKRASGVAHPRSSSLANDWLTVTETFGTEHITWFVLALAALGLVVALWSHRRPGPPDPSAAANATGSQAGDRAGSRSALIVYALLWGVVPMLFLSLAAADGAKVLIARYFLVAAPGWAILAGCGCASLGRAVAAVTRGRVVGATVGVVVPAAVIVTLGLHQEEAIRTAAGHDGDVRPVVALLRSAQNDHAAVVVPSVGMLPPVLAYGPDLIARMPLYRNPDRSAALILTSAHGAAAARRVQAYRRVAVVVEGDAAQADFYAHHVPGLPQPNIVSTFSRSGWSVAIVQR